MKKHLNELTCIPTEVPWEGALSFRPCAMELTSEQADRLATHKLSRLDREYAACLEATRKEKDPKETSGELDKAGEGIEQGSEEAFSSYAGYSALEDNSMPAEVADAAGEEKSDQDSSPQAETNFVPLAAGQFFLFFFRVGMQK